MLEGEALPHDTNVCNSRGKSMHNDLHEFLSLFPRFSWSGSIKGGPAWWPLAAQEADVEGITGIVV